MLIDILPFADKMPPKATVPRTLVNEKAMRRWLKEAGGDPNAQSSMPISNQPAVSANERRKKQKLDAQGEQQSDLKAKEDAPVTKTIPTHPPSSLLPHQLLL